MKNYELAYLISSDISEEEAKEIQEKVKSLLQKEGAFLNERKEILIKKRLAYPIKNKIQVYLASLEFQLSPEKIAVVEKNIKEEGLILRYLLITKFPEKEAKIKARRVAPLVKKPQKTPSEKKVELKEIEKKLEEILKE